MVSSSISAGTLATYFDLACYRDAIDIRASAPVSTMPHICLLGGQGLGGDLYCVTSKDVPPPPPPPNKAPFLPWNEGSLRWRVFV